MSRHLYSLDYTQRHSKLIILLRIRRHNVKIGIVRSCPPIAYFYISLLYSLYSLPYHTPDAIPASRLLLLLLPPQAHKLQIHRRHKQRRRQYPRHNQKVPGQARLRLKLYAIIPHSPSLPLPPPVILPLVRPRMARLVEMRHALVSEMVRVRPRAHAGIMMRVMKGAGVPGIGAVRLSS